MKKFFLKYTLLSILCLGALTGSHSLSATDYNYAESLSSDNFLRTITGKVVDADGEALIGVNVLVQGTNRGTITDIDGNFTIDAEPGEVLVVSYIGFSDQLVIVDENQSNYEILLGAATELLDEVVVIGYGTQKKSHTTGAISKVENKTLDQIAVARADEALIGQVSGVNIATTEGEAGSAPTITVRGVGSISADTGPALVIDGIVVDSDFLGNLDMNDVESFEVLKDAASAAIYGSEGSNGVILVTTKSGQEGKTKFSYNGFVGMKSAHASDNYRKSVADWAAFELEQTGQLTERTQYMQLLVDSLGVDRDWQDVFFEDGLIQSHSLSARGGNKQTKFSAALRYLGDEGVVITDDYNFYSAKLKLDTKLSDKLKLSMSVNPSYSDRRRLPTSIHNPLRQSPWLPIFHTEESLPFVDRDVYPDVVAGDYFREDHLVELDLDGDGSDTRPRTSGDANPYAQYVEREHNEVKTKVLSSMKLRYQLADGLSIQTSLGATLEDRRRDRYDGVLHHQNGTDRAQYQLQTRNSTRIINDNTVNYKKAIGSNEFDVLVGATFQQRDIRNSVVEGTGFTNDLLPNLQGATLISEFEELIIERNKIGYFGRVNFAHKDKYLVSASIRRDASSVFGFDSKWGTFPALSVGWNVAREPFFESSDLFSNLKFRVSYGLTGNENFDTGSDFTDFYPYLALLQSSNTVIDGSIVTGFSPENIANSVLQWEGSSEFNPGLDFGLWSNRVTGSFDYYNRTSDNLLLNNPVSYVSGFEAGIVNIGEVRNSGFEVELRSRNISRQNFSWSSTLIATTNQNELTDFGDSNGQILEDQFGRNSQWINLVGNPISSFYGFVVDQEATEMFSNGVEVDGETVFLWDTPFFPINSVSEDAVVRDLNGDGIITDADKTILGDPYPDLVWSLTNQVQLGAFDLSVMVQGSHGAEVRNVGDQYFGTHWQGSTISPQGVVEAGFIGHTSFLQERVLTDDIIQSASYLSLRNVTLGFDLDRFSPGLLNKLKLTNCRVYVTGQNLIFQTADDYNGFNPEFVESNSRIVNAWGSQRAGSPVNRTYTVGLNLDF
jgi:TonB-linked SusC/RagA family outer membrane protein